MAVERVTPDQAVELLDEGWKYLDVRSIPEFEQGHPKAAYNVPLMHKTAGGMRPNEDFVAVVEANFDKDEPLVVGCRSGSRSLRAAELLASKGYRNLVDMRGGFAGQTDASGIAVVEGWHERGYPISSDAEGRGYEDLKAK